MHPLQKENKHSRELGRPYAAVQVEHINKVLVVIPGSVSILKEETKITKLPSAYPVVDSEGYLIKPSGQFYITTETFDPYHMVIDLQLEHK
ncbi:hypothetical protein ACE41H_21560 [Paenibacillus enshidis]|uniref:Uncharacterized protein n=1 Tax=Paenibacillus enshidis TaxID=1458439 RepID=A0ABV5AZD5_9BACL